MQQYSVLRTVSPAERTVTFMDESRMIVRRRQLNGRGGEQMAFTAAMVPNSEMKAMRGRHKREQLPSFNVYHNDPFYSNDVLYRSAYAETEERCSCH